MAGEVRRAGGPPSRTRRLLASAVLLAPVVALLWVPSYATGRPSLAGVPFFYWYQLAWVPGCSLGLLAAHLLTRPRRSPL
ncbi:DUF3311 domain-containing protein [Streptomyces sp. NPDC006798]|uniref:DUF3311 domain-containing protein n=1 Tax=Streptomyces sp. NPDC006798 TaxID=3155462 RepID=UPI0033DD0F36